MGRGASAGGSVAVCACAVRGARGMRFAGACCGCRVSWHCLADEPEVAPDKYAAAAGRKKALVEQQRKQQEAVAAGQPVPVPKGRGKKGTPGQVTVPMTGTGKRARAAVFVQVRGGVLLCARPAVGEGGTAGRGGTGRPWLVPPLAGIALYGPVVWLQWPGMPLLLVFGRLLPPTLLPRRPPPPTRLPSLQRIMRGFIARRNVRILGTATRVVQRWWRQLQGRWALRRDIMELQAVVRGARQRKALQDTKVRPGPAEVAPAVGAVRGSEGRGVGWGGWAGWRTAGGGGGIRCE